MLVLRFCNNFHRRKFFGSQCTHTFRVFISNPVHDSAIAKVTVEFMNLNARIEIYFRTCLLLLLLRVHNGGSWKHFTVSKSKLHIIGYTANYQWCYRMAVESSSISSFLFYGKFSFNTRRTYRTASVIMPPILQGLLHRKRWSCPM